jgi:hypothetical protein
MSGIVEKSFYDADSDTLVVKTSYDNRDVIANNIADQNAAPETGRYKGTLVHVGRIHEGDIVRLKNEGYDLLSADPDEFKRALLHIQTSERHLLTLPGTPISKRKKVWV